MASRSPRRGDSGSKAKRTIIDHDLAGSSIGRTTWVQWLTLGAIVTVFPYYLSKLHYALPSPRPSIGTNGPQPSEELILGHIQALETIGYRTVGTHQAREGEIYVESEVRKLQEKCEEDGILDCDVYIQTGDGFHEFSIMDHDVLKAYKGINNIILTVRAKKPPSGPKKVEKDAVLLNSHIDSTLPAPGAADDGIGVGVMLDIARVLIDRKQPFDNSVIFLWNGAEETLQDGSHLYSKRHYTAKEAVINLEAAGTTGGALLFQATSKEMIEAFSHAPQGTVIAADVFSSGVLMSDTDFGQFEQYLNVSGLDMALVGHSYFYHTQKDRLEFIEIGAAQHFANNVMAILDHLLSPSSPLSSIENWSPPDMVYLTLYDRFFLSYTMETATKVYTALGAISLALSASRLPWKRERVVVWTFVGTMLGFVGGIVSANLVAGVMVLLDRQLSWFKHEHLCLVLFAPSGYIGNLLVQTVLSRKYTPAERAVAESAHLYAQSVFSTAGMLLLQAVGIRSAYIFAILSSVLLVGLIVDEVLRFCTGRKEKVGFWGTYILTMIPFAVIGVEAVTTVLDIFTPLVGRMGKDAPAEFIIATIASSNSFIFFPPLIPLFHRLTRPAQRRTISFLVVFVIGVVALFAGPWWKAYDSMHPKRAGFQYTYNHTTSTSMANIAFMDSGPEYDFVHALHERYGTDSPVTPTQMNKENSDWDILYPISSFLDTYRFELPPSRGFKWPEVGVKHKESRLEGKRKIDLTLDFTGLVWPTLAFNAEILDWSFDFPPPKGHKRHHIKMATGVESPIVDLSLTLANSGDEKVNIHWIAMDLDQMVPGTAYQRGPDMPGSKVLIDLHHWAKEKYDDSLEILTYAAVAGIIEV